MLRGEKWWLESGQAPENIYFSINVILLSMLFIYIGAVIGEHIYQKVERNNDNNQEKNQKKIQFRNNLQVVSMLAFYITMFFLSARRRKTVIYAREKLCRILCGVS